VVGESIGRLATAAEAAMQDDGEQARDRGEAQSPHARAMAAKRRELAAHQRAIKRHEEAAALQERFGHPDRAANARRHAQHARELYELAQQELQDGRSKAEPGTEPQDPATTMGAGPVSDGRGQAARQLRQLDAAWTALGDSYAGLDDDQLVEPGVVEDWSVKDILAHVTTWEEEALRHLPLIIAGGTPPRYAEQGGIDAFNARATEAGRRRSLAEVLRRRDETHARLVEFIRDQPAGTFGGRTRARRRLRLDTYGHYPEHTEAIRAWREARQA
jgi:hypothetical protein